VSKSHRVKTHAKEEKTTMSKLDGKVAVVTGSARGLGRAYAKRLAGLGAKVAVADLNLCKRRSKNPSLKRPVGPVAPE
jgi:3-oxoacyl-[acyl-carrier protein] reductase